LIDATAPNYEKVPKTALIVSNRGKPPVFAAALP
jgi:hypothetical protein